MYRSCKPVELMKLAGKLTVMIGPMNAHSNVLRLDAIVVVAVFH